MSAVAQAAVTEESRVPGQPRSGIKGRQGTMTPSTSVEDLSWNGYSMKKEVIEDGAVRTNVRGQTFTPPPRKDSVGANSINQSPAPSVRSASRSSSLNVPNENGSPILNRNGGQLLSPDRLPLPILDSTLPSSSPVSPSTVSPAPQRLKFVGSNLSSTSSPRNSFPSISNTSGNPSPASSTFQAASRDTSSKTLSAQSTLSAATSNSSHLPVPQSSPYPASTSSFTSDPEVTAGLIRMLYARLDAQGVRGDGWDEGKERTRDGIINREVAEGGQSAIRPPEKGKGAALPLNQDEEARADQVLRRVDR